jgi:NADH-quinone oxidoreductase subunit J
MIPEFVLFWAVAVVSVAGGLGVVFSPKPVHAVLSLLIAMFGLSVGFYALGSPLLAAMQIIIYAGAVIVLFLFVVMLLDISDLLPSLGAVRATMRAVTIVGALIFGGALIALIVGGTLSARSISPPEASVEAIGRALYRDHVALILLIGILLTAAADGVVGLTRSGK